MISQDRKSVSIRSVLVISYILLLLATIGVLAFITYSNWSLSVKNVISQIAQSVNNDIYEKIENYIAVPKLINSANINLVEDSIIDINDTNNREKFFVNVLDTYKQGIYSFSYGDENGEYYGARRNEKKEIEIMRNNTATGGQSWYYSVTKDMTAGQLVKQAGLFDPRTRDWYKAAKEAGVPVFSPVYKHFVMDDLTISAAYPVYNKSGSFKGVLGTHIVLTNIDTFLQEIANKSNGLAVIFEKTNGNLIANSMNLKNFITTSSNEIQRTKITEVDNKTIQTALSYHSKNKMNNFILKTGHDFYSANFTEYEDNGLNWVILSAVSHDSLMTTFYYSINITLLLFFLAVLLSSFIYYFLIKYLLRPINSLIDVTDNLANGDLEQRVNITRNDEIGLISRSFNKMADTISSLVNNLESAVKDRTKELKDANDALEISKEQLKSIFDSTAEGIFGLDKVGNCIFCNASSLRMLGYSNDKELLGKNLHYIIHHSYRNGNSMPIENCKMYQSFYEGKKIHVEDEVFWRTDGSFFDVEYYSYPQYKKGELIGSVVTFTDNTQRKRDNEQLQYLSCHDPLTGLLNRRCFEEKIVKLNRPENLPFSIIFGDLNSLKLTNDIFGHKAGDELIKRSSEILLKACGTTGLVARIGGDEFVILLPNTNMLQAEALIDTIKDMLSIEKIDAVKCSMSLGCDTKTDSEQDMEKVMANAENAMYKDKSAKRKEVGSETINTILATLYERCPYQKNHSEHVSRLSVSIGKCLGLEEAQIVKIAKAASLHDIGKIIYDESLLKKQNCYTEQDKKEIQRHPATGYRILNMFDDTLDLADDIYSHHEWWDGTGYPNGLKGNEIPLIARIITVAEAFDALTSPLLDHPIGEQDAMSILTELSGTRLDPQIVNAMNKCIKPET